MDLLAHLKSETHRGGAGTAERPLCGGADCPEGTRLRPCPRGGRPLVQKGTELWHSLLSPPTLLGFCQAFASTDVRCYRALGVVMEQASSMGGQMIWEQVPRNLRAKALAQLADLGRLPGWQDS